ncbi:hypothetical protein KEM55_008450, partial [Ascosphaera atra]
WLCTSVSAKLGVTPELLKLVTGLAHYLKLLIRIGLQGALRYEREFSDPTQLYVFLATVEDLAAAQEITSASALVSSMVGLSDQSSDRCVGCAAPVDDECVIFVDEARDGAEGGKELEVEVKGRVKGKGGTRRRHWHASAFQPCFRCAACDRNLVADVGSARWIEKAEKVVCVSCIAGKEAAGDDGEKKQEVGDDKALTDGKDGESADEKDPAAENEVDAGKKDEKEDDKAAAKKQQLLQDARATGGVQAGFIYVSRLAQYVYLLQVALARLLAVLRSSGGLPHATDDINVRAHNDLAFTSPPRRAQTTRGKSTAAGAPSGRRAMPPQAYGGGAPNEASSLEQTVGEIKRLHSKRRERTQRTLSTTFKTARASRIIDGPRGRSACPGSPSADAMLSSAGGAGQGNEKFRIVEERAVGPNAMDQARQRNDHVFQDTLNLDDIQRIVAAERAKERKAGSKDLGMPGGIISGGVLIGDGDGQGDGLGGAQRRDGTTVWDAQSTAGTLPGQRPKYFYELTSTEYFVVRHLAAMHMQALLEGQFTLDELINLIEPRKPTGFWTTVGRVFKNDRPRAAKKKGVFGVPLEILVEKDGTESTHGVLGSAALKVPTFVDDCVSAMRQMDMSVEGVFRKNGNIKRLKETSDLIDTRYESVDLNRETPVQVAALLKKFLREMPEPLLTYKLYKLLLASQNLSDPEKKRRVLHLACCLLPKPFRDTTEVLFNFLNWAASFSQIDDESGSKMDVHNLATVIAPGVLRPDDGRLPPGPSTPATFATGKNVSVGDGLLAIEAVSSLVEFVDTMAEVPREVAGILNDQSIMSAAGSLSSAEIIKKLTARSKLTPAQQQQQAEQSQAQAQQNPNQSQQSLHGKEHQDRMTSGNVLVPEAHQVGMPMQSAMRNQALDNDPNSMPMPIRPRVQEREGSHDSQHSNTSSIRHPPLGMSRIPESLENEAEKQPDAQSSSSSGTPNFLSNISQRAYSLIHPGWSPLDDDDNHNNNFGNTTKQSQVPGSSPKPGQNSRQFSFRAMLPHSDKGDPTHHQPLHVPSTLEKKARSQGTEEETMGLVEGDNATLSEQRPTSSHTQEASTGDNWSLSSNSRPQSIDDAHLRTILEYAPSNPATPSAGIPSAAESISNKRDGNRQ